MSLLFGKIETIDGRRQTCILTHNCDRERQRCSPQILLEKIYFNVHISLLSWMYFCFFYVFLPSLALRVFSTGHKIVQYHSPPLVCHQVLIILWVTPADLCWPTSSSEWHQPLNTKAKSVRNDKYAWATCTHMMIQRATLPTRSQHGKWQDSVSGGVLNREGRHKGRIRSI